MAQVVQALQVQGHAITWCCPQLPPSPAEAVALMQHLVHAWPLDRLAVIGSSLGGFYATVLAEQLGCRAVLINPAVDPARDPGESTSANKPAGTTRKTPSVFRPEFVDELARATPSRHLAARPLFHTDRHG